METGRNTYLCFLVLLAHHLIVLEAQAQRQAEYLDRGLLALRVSETEVYVGWRMLGTDPGDIGFDLYRSADGVTFTKLNDAPVKGSTNWVDIPGNFSKPWIYVAKPVRGDKTYPAAGRVRLQADPPVVPGGLDQAYLSVPVRTDISTVDRIGVGDLDGDGSYDFVVKHPQQVADPGVFVKPADTYKLDAYRSNGEFLWRRDLGWNIVLGIWWSPMIVYDLDGDGRAEVISKTAPTDVDYRNVDGRVLTGPEFLTIFDGLSGEILAREDWIPRGNISDWGDSYGNRVNRNMMCIAYLDGQRPSLVIFRGIYGLQKAEAWNYRDEQLTPVWSWSNEDLGPQYQSQGFHNIRVGDIDQDGRDEIMHGAIALDDDGSVMYSTGQGHGDRFVLTDIDPAREGLELWYIQEDPAYYDYAVHLRDAATGAFIFGKGDDTWGDVGRGIACDIDPGYAGLEVWAPQGALYSAAGEEIYPENPRYANTFVCEYGVWWDDDLLRELTQGGRLLKFNYNTGMVDRIGTALRAFTIADILGDWREEIIGFSDGQLRIFTPSVPSSRRFHTFMHDPVYRPDVATMTMGYAQSANTGFYFGEGMEGQPVYELYTAHQPDTSPVEVPARLDFGCIKGSPVKEGYREILASGGYGWIDPLVLEDRRGDTTDALLQDQILGWEPTVFQVPVNPGEYEVVIYAGDHTETSYTRVFAEGTPFLDHATVPGMFKADSFTVRVNDGVLDLAFSGSPWRISGIDVKSKNPASSSMPVIGGSVPFLSLDRDNRLLLFGTMEDIERIDIWNVKGQLRHSSVPRQKQVNVSGLEPGIYIVRLQSRQKLFTGKILIHPR